MKNLWLVDDISENSPLFEVSDGLRYYQTSDSSDAEWLCETLNAIENFKDQSQTKTQE